MKQCRQCNEKKPEDQFYTRKNGTLRHQCKSCLNAKRRYDVISNMLSGARYRADQKGLEFNVTRELVLELQRVQDNKCALTGWGLDWTPVYSGKRICPYNRVSLDRIDSQKGYIPGNVQLLADMVNRIKSNYPQDLFVEMCVSISQRCHL